MGTKTTRIRLVLVSAILIVLAMMGISKMRAGAHWNFSDPADTLSILVADRYIPAFTVIKPDMVRPQEFPKGLVPPGALRDKADLENENKQMLFTSAIAIPEGQPVTRALVTDASQNDTLGSLIRPGKVAVSFEIDKAHGVGGWIRPGDTVALFGETPMTIGLHSLSKKTRLLFPSIIVLAVDDKRLGQTPSKEDERTDPASIADTPVSTGAKIVTVLVGLSEAAEIVEAREDGHLSVVLRSLGDDLPWPAK